MVTVAQPKVRPLELAQLDPGRPFSITLIFSPMDTPDFPRALELARQTPGFTETGTGAGARYQAKFLTGDAARLVEVFNVVQRASTTEVVVDDMAVPYGRELWMPLVRFFVNA
jgi:hypothetical protein